MKIVLFLLMPLMLICLIYSTDASILPKWFHFNKENALQEWEEKIFKYRVLYVVKPDQNGGYLSAKSDEACSGLLHRITLDTKKTPMISWYWRVIKFPDKSKDKNAIGGWIEKDDYAARVYVIFPSFNFMWTRSIEYVWDKELPEGTMLTSPYFGRIKLIVIESGEKNKGRWVFEEQNIYEDYKKAFGREPSSVGAIALMTDTDNTLSTAETLYRDIKVGYKNERKK